MPRAKWTLAIIVTLIVGATRTLSVAAQTLPADPQQVVQAFELASASGDTDVALARLADDVVLTVMNQGSRTYTGKDQVRLYLLTTNAQLRTLTRTSPIVAGASVTWSERDQLQGQTFDVSAYATVRSGLIATLVYRAGTTTDGLSGTPQGVKQASQQTPTMAWSAAIGVLGLLLLAVVFCRPRRRASISRLDGRLMHELRRQYQAERGDKAA